MGAVRRIWLAVAAVLASAVAAVPANAAPAPQHQPGYRGSAAGPGPHAGFSTYAAAPRFAGSDAIATVPTGMSVRVDPHATHVARIATAVEYAVGQLRRYGIGVRYGGVAPAAATVAGASAFATITVGEARDPADPACHRGRYADAGAVTEGVADPSMQDVGVLDRINSATLTFCPPVWGRGDGYVTAVALHELGHAVGLGHYAGSFAGRVQVMNPIVPDVRTYQPGDINGLRYLAEQTRLLAAHSHLSGAIEHWTVDRHGLAVSGWARVGSTAQYASVTVTRDGQAVYRIATATPRADVLARHPGAWALPGFTGAAVPMAGGRHEYCVRISDPGRLGAARTLGCRMFAYPVAAVPDLEAQPSLPLAAVSDTVAVRALAAAVGVLLLVLVGLGVRRRRQS